jgi:ubiquinone/menaquinone biosynthesis C-methylase UbiE
MSGDNTVLEAFTELAPRYEETMDRELRGFLGIGYQEFVDRLLEMAAVKEGETVLDVATGTALLPRTVATRASVVGLDITPDMLVHGRTKIEASGAMSSIRLICASGMAMPFAAGLFDVVICGFGAHHMDVPTMLNQMKRVARPGGRLALNAAGAPPFWRSPWASPLLRVLVAGLSLIGQSARIQAELSALAHVLTATEWRGALSKAGFTQINIAESFARRRWYPRVLAITAQTGGD